MPQGKQGTNLVYLNVELLCQLPNANLVCPYLKYFPLTFFPSSKNRNSLQGHIWGHIWQEQVYPVALLMIIYVLVKKHKKKAFCVLDVSFSVRQEWCHNPVLLPHCCRREQCRVKQIINRTHSLLNKVRCRQLCYMWSVTINNWCYGAAWNLFWGELPYLWLFTHNAPTAHTRLYLTTNSHWHARTASLCLRRECSICIDVVSYNRIASHLS